MSLPSVSRRSSPSVPGCVHGATYRSRFECKYLISNATADGIREFLRPFARPDKHAARCPGFRYAVNSLYLDSPELLLYAQTLAGEKARFKLRVRTYSDAPNSQAFFEVKKKVDCVVSKRRAGLSREHARMLLEERSLRFLDQLSPKVQEDLQYFQHYARTARARPVARVRYLREAYEARSNEPVRITFDSDLAHAVTTDGNLSLHDGSWVDTPIDGVILELKFTERLPGWAQALVRDFRLDKTSVPKYVMSIDRMLQDTATARLAAARRQHLGARR